MRDCEYNHHWRQNFIETQKQVSKLKALSRQIEYDIKGNTHELETEVADYERQIERWKKSPQSRQKREPVPREKPQPRVIRRPGGGPFGMSKEEMDAYTGF
ncbi:hypothetical protein WDW37_21100 [Bdellovibrionota bacterium FG-1]